MSSASTSATAPDVTFDLGSVSVDLRVEPDQPVRLRAVRPTTVPLPANAPAPGLLVELGLHGQGRTSPLGPRHMNLAGSHRLRPVDVAADGDVLTVTQQDLETGLRVETVLAGEPAAPALRATTTVTNTGDSAQTLAYVSSGALRGVGAFTDGHPCSDPGAVVHVPYNTWTAEARWHSQPLAAAGLADIGSWPGPNRSAGSRDGSKARIDVTGLGTWSTAVHLPMGAISVATAEPASGLTWLWQLENNGAWGYELCDVADDVLVRMHGPTDSEHDWRHVVAPGESFVAVAMTLVACTGGLGEALRAITTTRRAHRRAHPDNTALPVIFNDYMNCLMGDPTTEKLLPVIDAAADLGAEYFVIDAGWYADDAGWWSTVGEWQPSTTRFPNGLAEVTDHIRERGMVPGLWLEPEVIGVHSPLAGSGSGALPDDAFFSVDGIRLVEAGRHQLDFRHPAVRAHLDETVDRLVEQFGVGYFKLDYNINPGHGTTEDAASRGDGLLGHNRAFLRWVDDVLDRHPDLVLENCSSGGCRMEYGQLSHLTLQSTSDQQDPVRYAAIAAAVPSAVAPEQSATWAYPQPDYSDDLNAFTLINALLGRIHLSGRVDLLDERQRARLKAGLDAYKSYRAQLPAALPTWPLGLPEWDDDWVAAGLDLPDGDTLLAVWRRGGDASCRLPGLGGRTVEVVYPADPAVDAGVGSDGTDLVVELPAAPAARLLRLR